MNIDDLTIGQARKIASQFSTPACNPAKIGDYGLQIVVLDRGFVYVGNVEIDGDWCLITAARNVRRWGTSKGLGELAASGPLKDTVLDPAGRVRAPLRALIALIKCDAAKWSR